MRLPRVYLPTLYSLANQSRQRARSQRLRLLVVALTGALFWCGLVLIARLVLRYFAGIEVIGAILAAKLLGMILLTLLSILLFSCLVCALSEFFMARDLEILMAAPVDPYERYYLKFGTTAVHAAWMVVLFSLPFFLAYGLVFDPAWWYYPACLAGIAALVLIATAAGALVALLLVSCFPARRMKDLFVLMGLVVAIGCYLLFRLIKPERLVAPDAFFSVLDYLSSLSLPGAPVLPSQWLADVLAVPLFSPGAAVPTIPALLLLVGALGAIYAVSLAYARWYSRAWARAQEAAGSRRTITRVAEDLSERVFARLPSAAAAFIQKDIRYFFRDPSQWSQLLVLGAIIVIYLYNFSVLPLDRSPIPTRQLQNLFAFLNLALAGFVVCAVAVRFVFPAVSIEGLAYWYIASSPVPLATMLWSKFWMYCCVLLLLVEALIVCSNLLLHVEPFMMWVSCLTAALMTVGLTGMGIGIGACYPRFRHPSIAQIPSSFGGFLYMLLAVFFIALVIMLEAWPVHRIMESRLHLRALHPTEVTGIVLSFAAVGVACVLALLIPMRLGIRALMRHDCT